MSASRKIIISYFVVLAWLSALAQSFLGAAIVVVTLGHGIPLLIAATPIRVVSGPEKTLRDRLNARDRLTGAAESRSSMEATVSFTNAIQPPPRYTPPTHAHSRQGSTASSASSSSGVKKAARNL